MLHVFIHPARNVPLAYGIASSCPPSPSWTLGLVLHVPGGLLQVDVALLVRPAGTEAGADEGGPRAALEEEDGEHDAEADAEGRLDEEVREAAVPLQSIPR